jgi:hypothetical protein
MSFSLFSPFQENTKCESSLSQIGLHVRVAYLILEGEYYKAKTTRHKLNNRNLCRE